jgi:hypothetical protein
MQLLHRLRAPFAKRAGRARELCAARVYDLAPLV